MGYLYLTIALQWTRMLLQNSVIHTITSISAGFVVQLVPIYRCAAVDEISTDSASRGPSAIADLLVRPTRHAQNSTVLVDRLPCY